MTYLELKYKIIDLNKYLYFELAINKNIFQIIQILDFINYLRNVKENN